MSEVIRAAVPPWPPPRPPPRLRSSERGSGSLHLAQRFSNLISSRRAKGWRPRPDLPGNGVCVKRFLWRGVLVHQSPPPPRLHRSHPTGPGAPPVAVWWKGSLSCPQVNRHLNGAAVGVGQGHLGGGRGEIKVVGPASKCHQGHFWVSALPVSEEVKRGERVHARLTSGLQMGQNCHGPSPSYVERRFPVKLNIDRWGTAPVCPSLWLLQDSLCLQVDEEPGSRTRRHLWIRLLQVPGSGREAGTAAEEQSV